MTTVATQHAAAQHAAAERAAAEHAASGKLSHVGGGCVAPLGEWAVDAASSTMRVGAGRLRAPLLTLPVSYGRLVLRDPVHACGAELWVPLRTGTALEFVLSDVLPLGNARFEVEADLMCRPDSDGPTLMVFTATASHRPAPARAPVDELDAAAPTLAVDLVGWCDPAVFAPRLPRPPAGSALARRLRVEIRLRLRPVG
jgi:hypothetical protein